MEESVGNKFTFRGGIHPKYKKEDTASIALQVFPAPKKVTIPMNLHIGTPAQPIVKVGDEVSIGTKIGESNGNFSLPVYASIAGTVSAIKDATHPNGAKTVAVEITNNGELREEKFSPIIDWQTADKNKLLYRIKEAGIAGRGGACFPTHIKLSPPPSSKVDTLIINGAECEPYLTADHRLMLERTESILYGIAIVRKILSVKKVYIGIEKNKQDAIKALKKEIKSNDMFSDFIVIPLETKYPQGGEKQLIHVITAREVPSGKLPMDAGCVVSNVGTCHSISKAIIKGIPLHHRVVTISGEKVKRPSNLVIPIGTSVKDILAYCETDFTSLDKVIMGGPMMGMTLPSLDIPIIKATSGLITINEKTFAEQAYNCINCGACVEVCPIHLIPSHFSKLVRKSKFEECEDKNILDCIECGSCSYICPSKINLVHYIRVGKSKIISTKKGK